jgi:protein TonB
MKFLVLLLLTITTVSLKAQIKNDMKLCENDSINGKLIHTIAEVSPEYKGGVQKFYKDISSKIKLKDRNDIGCIRVVLSFVIDVDGNIKNVCSTDNVEVTKEIIESINNWTPGKIEGINVPVRMHLPMYIKVNRIN